MHDIRCRCGKIVCQVENMPVVPRIEERVTPHEGPVAVIMCRHCKRFVVLQLANLAPDQAGPAEATSHDSFLSATM